MTPFAAAIVVAGGIAAASARLAEDNPTANPALRGQGMMGGQQNQGMMGMMMTQMVENCNRMMEGANNNPHAPTKPPAQTPG
jgi:hypothetical protein